MRLTWLTIFVALNAYQAVNGLSNDIVGTMRCRLLCKEADGYAPELKDKHICKCNIAKKLSDKQLLKVQELSTYYDLPVVFEREHHNYKVKRQLDDSWSEDWSAKLNEHWAEAADNLKAWGEQQRRRNPIFDDIEEHAEKLRAMHEQQARENPLVSHLEEHAENLKSWQEQLKENIPLGDLEEHAENLQAWHNDNFEAIQEGLQDQKDKLDEHLGKLKDFDLGDMTVGAIGPKFEEQAEQLKQFHEDHIQPLLGDFPAQFEENMEKLKSLQLQPNEPVLGQMAPSLIAYDSKATGIGGSNVNFPPPNVPNPFIPPLAHIIRALPIPRLDIPVGAASGLFAPPVVPPAAAGFPLPPPFPRVFSRSMAGPSLPVNYAGPYNPRNPIVVQPVVLPNHHLANPTPKPILAGLQNSVDDMLASMKKNGGRLIPENYLNSDALSNSESQVNQINVNVRVEPTSTAANFYSMFLPYNRNWLSAPAPKNLDEHADEVTEDPAIIDSDEDADDRKQNNGREADASGEVEDYEEEHRMQKQLKDADKSKFNAHVVDSVKRNLASKGSRQKQAEKEEMDPGKYNNNGLIVQPQQFMQDSEEDLETLAK